MHIEQARVLQDTGKRIGVVNAIAGYVHADVHVQGRGDHGRVREPMGLPDPTTVLAETVLELERLATVAGHGTVGTVGEIEVDPGLINAVAARTWFSLDMCGPSQDVRFQAVARDIAAFAAAAARRGMSARHAERQTLLRDGARRTDRRGFEAAAAETGEPWTTMHPAPRTTRCACRAVPSAMVFALQGRDQPPPRRGGRSGGCRARRRDHPARDRQPLVGKRPRWASTANDQTPASAAKARPWRAVPARIVAAPEAFTKPIAVAGLRG